MSTPTCTELAEHLTALVTYRLLDPLSILLASDTPVDPLRERVRTEADDWANRLLDEDETTVVRTASRLLAALYPGDTPFEPPEAWWGTPLGAVIARRIGHPTAERVSYAVAGAMLGITRQGVHDLVTRQKLHRHPDGGVTSSSIRDRLAAS
jgi:hypothetical protein